MDADRFDNLARLIGSRTSRRLAVGLAATGLLAITVPEAEAARCSKRKPCPECKKCKKHKCKPDAEQNGGACNGGGTCQNGQCQCTGLPSGSECTDATQCCSGTCEHNTFGSPNLAKVCCKALGATCTLPDECCGEASCGKGPATNFKWRCIAPDCQLKGSGLECSDESECCSGTCDHNTAYDEVDKVCCRAQGEPCRFGLNECCGDLGCNSNSGVCG